VKPPLASAFSFSVQQIIEAARTWARYTGFEGDTCSGHIASHKSGRCHLRANVPAGGPGWHCICGHYNIQSWNFHQKPHEHPDLGPPALTLRRAYAQLDNAKAQPVSSFEEAP
jgi:hypothetical protein